MGNMTKGSGTLLFVVLFLATALAAGCADVGMRRGDASADEIAQLRRDLNALTLAYHRNRADNEAVVAQADRRQREQAAEAQRQAGQLSSKIDAMSSEVTRLTARVDDLAQRVESLNRQVSGRAAAPSPAAPAPTPPAPGAGTAPGGPKPAPAPGGTAAVPPPAPVPSVPGAPRPGEGPTPEQAYQAAYIDFSKGNYPLAIQGFREFVRRYPDSDLADNAQYWIGESFFSMARASANQGQA